MMTIDMLRSTALDRANAMRLAATEYQRVLDLLRALEPSDWTKPTDCPGWDVRAMAAHLLGMVEMAASTREMDRQIILARRCGGLLIDAITELQVAEREAMTPAQILDRFAVRAPKAAAARRRTPGSIRRRTLPTPRLVNDQEERWTVGYLFDIIWTRDQWMHRIDIVRTTGAPHVLTTDHDNVLVADVVNEWADRHGQPFTLRLTGPAGGTWSRGSGGPNLELDAVEFCRTLSGRESADGLLNTEVPF